MKLKDRSKEIIANFTSFRLAKGWSYGDVAIYLGCRRCFVCAIEQRKKKAPEAILAKMVLLMFERR